MPLLKLEFLRCEAPGKFVKEVRLLREVGWKLVEFRLLLLNPIEIPPLTPLPRLFESALDEERR